MAKRKTRPSFKADGVFVEDAEFGHVICAMYKEYDAKWLAKHLNRGIWLSTNRCLAKDIRYLKGIIETAKKWDEYHDNQAKEMVFYLLSTWLDELQELRIEEKEETYQPKDLRRAS